VDAGSPPSFLPSFSFPPTLIMSMFTNATNTVIYGGEFQSTTVKMVSTPPITPIIWTDLVHRH
jgi:hypothetical protein